MNRPNFSALKDRARKAGKMVNRRAVIVVSLALLLVATGYLNYRYNNPADGATTANTGTQAANIDLTDPDAAAASTAGFFATFRGERTSSREQQIAELDAIIAAENTDKEILKDAQSQKLELTKSMETETTIEGLIKTKGFEDAVAMLHDQSANVVVKAGELDQTQVAQILDIVKTESGKSADQITIIPAQ